MARGPPSPTGTPPYPPPPRSPPKRRAHGPLFSSRGHYHARTPIRFTEARARLRHVLPADALRHALRWDFGDGTHALGWAVTHRYAHAGIYRITVNASYSSWHQYFPFDNVRISIAR